MKKGISIIIAGYNEEDNISNAVGSVLRAIKGLFTDYEVIVVDDGSTDTTAQVVAAMMKKNRRIRLIKQGKNGGFGSAFRIGITKASKKYISGFPGDNDMSWKSLRQIITKRNEADFILSYMENQEARSFARRIYSEGFIILMNSIFGLRIKYFNGYFVTRTNILKSFPLISDGFTLFAEIIIRALKKPYTYIEIPFFHTERKYGRSKSVTLKSLVSVIKTVLILRLSI